MQGLPLCGLLNFYFSPHCGFTCRLESSSLLVPPWIRGRTLWQGYFRLMPKMTSYALSLVP